MGIPTRIASEDEWRAELAELLDREKAATHARDDAAAARRRLPMVPVTGTYTFERGGKEHPFGDLFEGRRQLIVYRFFIDPGMQIAEYPSGCPGCTTFADNLPKLTHLNARDTTFAMVSAGEQDAIEAYRKRMGWDDWAWYTSRDSWCEDFGVDQWYGVNVFFRDGDDIYRTYYASGRAAEDMGTMWGLLDLTPYGRGEEWQDVPDGVPQVPTGSWFRRRDDYTPEELGLGG
jgi:predicted dithiol-disulfide oxidoreductase (DUF899 family)